ncbi:MAG: hypothetical protein LBU32_00385 [Clostridiales bacterium]|jgi:hypothetical protein|nr:hypothetical protein [Clostridiales bacterium]
MSTGCLEGYILEIISCRKTCGGEMTRRLYALVRGLGAIFKSGSGYTFRLAG